MKHPSRQNFPNALDPLKQVETRDRVSLYRPKWIETPSIKSNRVATNTDINAISSVEIPEDSTVMQAASPPKVEAENSETIVQKLPNPSPQEDAKKLNEREIAVVQNLDNTIIQYSDSAIHNPAEQTVCQTKMSSSLDLDLTVCQSKIPQSSHSSTLATMPKNSASSLFRDLFRTSGSFISRLVSIAKQFFHSIRRKIDPRQLQSRIHRGRQQAVLKSSAKTSSSSINYSSHNAIASQEQPNLEQYQKKLRELDYCRLSFAKELARNGKFRDAIAMAEQISETSHFFKDAQKLIQSWKQF